MRSRLKVVLAIGLVVSLFTASFSAMAQNNDNDNDIDIDPDDITFDHEFEIHGFDFRSPEFYNVWERTDKPVLDGDVERSWLWGPRANTNVFEEPYVEADDGMREVQYGDKSRMEMPVPGSAAAAEEEDSPWNITQGLLATELMTGNLQIGDNTFLPFAPAEIPVAGDWEDNPGPTYADMGQYMGWDPRPAGATITQYLDGQGNVQDDTRFAEYEVTDEYYIEQTDHNIASVFWDFMRSEGLVYIDGELETDRLFLNEFYAIGFPVTEAYWGEFRLQNEVQDILIQCFERRCLTFAPDNEPAWQVESGNVGLHYHEWRYNIIDIDDPITETTLELDPVDATNEIGTEHTLTATIADNGTQIDIDDADDVSISVSRATENDENGTNNGNNNSDVDVNETITVDDGVATITYTGPDSPAVDTIEVTVDYNDEDLSATATKTWAEYVLTLEQDEAFNLIGTDHNVTATLTADGEPVEGAEIQLFIDHSDESVPGIGPGGFGDDIEEPLLTDDQGQYTFTYTRSTAGTETIEAFHPDPDGIESDPASLTKTWQTVGEFYDCAVVDSGDSIQAAIDEATEGDTICVLAGTYGENIEIDLDGLTLWALYGPEETTIQSDNAGVGAAGTPGVVGINADDVVVDGFTIDNEDADNGRTIRVNSNVDGLTIQNNVLENSDRGVQGDWDGQGGDNITIEDNVFNTAIGVGGTEGMTGLMITGNTFNTTTEGIGLGEGLASFTITSNHFAGDEDHVRDWRTTPDTTQLEDIIDNNTFENAVEIVNGNAIRDQ